MLAAAIVHAADTRLAVEGRTNSTPSIAADGTSVVVAWGAAAPGGSTDVFAAVSGDGGNLFGPPVRVNDIGGDARLSGEQPPRVAMHGKRITVIWTTKGATGTMLKHALSGDGGQSFGHSTVVPGSDAAGNRGWEAIAVDRNGRFDAVWLDHRELARQDGPVAAAHHQHQPPSPPGTSVPPGNLRPRQEPPSPQQHDGVAMAQRSKLYFASLDGALAPRALTGGVCYCCKTALATGVGGSLAGVLLVSLVAGYSAAVLVNAARIAVAMWLAAHPIPRAWMTAAQVHRVEGIAFYFGGLVLLYELVRRFDGRPDAVGSMA